MAILKRKVYTKTNDGVKLVDLTKDIDSENVNNGLGQQVNTLLDVVDYHDDISSESLLQLTADLLSNDIAIHDEKNAINSVYNIGVIKKLTGNFDFNVANGKTVTVDSSTLYTYDAILDQGSFNYKYKDDDNIEQSNVLSISSMTSFPISPITTGSKYRRDNIFIIVKDTLNENAVVPRLECNITKNSLIPTLNALTDSATPSINNNAIIDTNTFVAYPLYSILSYSADGITTQHVSFTQVFDYCGMQAIQHIEKTIPCLIQFADPRKNYFQLFRTNKKGFCDKNGIDLIANYGQASENYSDGGDSVSTSAFSCSLGTNGAYQLLKDDLDSINESSRFIFPFMVQNQTNDYLTNNTIATITGVRYKMSYSGSDDSLKEGIESHIFTMAHFCDSHYTSQFGVSACDSTTYAEGSVISLGSFNPYSLTHITYTGSEINDSTTPNVGDCILVVSGTGAYQVSRIISISASGFTVQKLLINLDTTSKIMVFKNGTEKEAGVLLNNEEQASDRYKNTYWYDIANNPTSVNTSISRIPFEGVNYNIKNNIDADGYFTAPFEVDLEFGVWYFIKTVVLNKQEAGAVYNDIPSLYVTKPSNAPAVGFVNGDFSITYRNNFGLYVIESKNTTFSLEDFYGGIYTSSDARNLNPQTWPQSTDPSIPPHLPTNDDAAGQRRPKKYYPKAVNLIDDSIASGIIEPKSGEVWIDVLSGRIKFNHIECPTNLVGDQLYITGYINNVVYGNLLTDNVFHWTGSTFEPLSNFLFNILGGALTVDQLTLGKTLYVKGDAGFGDDVTIEDTLMVGGKTVLNNTLEVADVATFDKTIIAKTGLDVKGTATLEGMVDITGTLMPPRLTQSQIDVLVPTSGMIVFNTTANRLMNYKDSSWAILDTSMSKEKVIQYSLIFG